MKHYRELAALLTAEIKKRDLTQAKFGKLLGLSQPMVCCLLAGSKTVSNYDVIAKIADLTGKSLEEIGRLASDGRR